MPKLKIEKTTKPKKIAIIGAGIIGLSCAWYALRSGHDVVTVDPAPEGDKASFGNVGGIAMTEIIPASTPSVFLKVPQCLFDPLGPLSLRWGHAPKLLPWMFRFSQASTKSEMLRITAALSSLNSRVDESLKPMLDYRTKLINQAH